jgi:excisionase family DNA binding protein
VNPQTSGTDRSASSSPIASRPRSPGWPSRVSEANHASDTKGALDGQHGDLTIQPAGRTKLPATDTREVLMEKLLLTVAEAASALSVCRSRVYELIYAGELESVKIRGSRRVHRQALERFVDGLRGPKDAA